MTSQISEKLTLIIIRYRPYFAAFLASLVVSVTLLGNPAPVSLGDQPQDLFSKAARDGDIAAMTELLAAFPDAIDINHRNESTLPPLYLAIQFRRTDAALFLMDKGAQLTLRSINSRGGEPLTISPMGFAIRNNQTKVLERLLREGVRPENVYFSPRPVVIAVNNDFIECLDLLVQYGVDPLAVKFSNRGDPIHMLAASVGAHRVLERLIELGAAVNHTNDNGLTPLHLAAGSRSLETVNVLLEAGANVNATFRWGSYSTKVTPLVRAVETGNLEIVERLLAAGADVSVDGYYALYCASVLGDREIYERLIRAGAKPDEVTFRPLPKVVLVTNTEVGITDTLEQSLKATLKNS